MDRFIKNIGVKSYKPVFSEKTSLQDIPEEFKQLSDKQPELKEQRFDPDAYWKYEIYTPGHLTEAGPNDEYYFGENARSGNFDRGVKQKLQTAIKDDFKSMRKETGLAEYIHPGHDKIIADVINIPAPVIMNADMEKFTLLWTVYSRSRLDSKGMQALVDYIDGQCSDGWGEGFEQHSFDKYIGPDEEICPDCDGTGEDGEGNRCEECRGTGYVEEDVEFELFAQCWDPGSGRKSTIKFKGAPR